MDAKPLFTSINKDLIVHALELIVNKTHHHFMQKDKFVKLIPLIFALFDMQIFRFENKFYKQSKGIFMGLAASALIAEWAMSFIEDRALSILDIGDVKIPLFIRYVDDILCYADSSILEDILDIFNHISNEVQFEIEKEKDGGLPYLDIMLKRSNGQINSSVYRKPTYGGSP